MHETELFRKLIRQEKRLHRPWYRGDYQTLSALLHPAFFEFCRSGVSADKDDTLNDLLSPVQHAQHIYSGDYRCSQISGSCVLITYRSFQLAGGRCIRETNRSSLWTETAPDIWQLRFHQGTPSEREE